MTTAGPIRPVAIDPPGCGCCRCMIGEHVPLDRTSPDLIRAMLAGEISDHTGGEWTVMTEVRFERGSDRAPTVWRFPAQTGPLPAYDGTAVERLLRRVARPGSTSREELQLDAAGLLVQLGATCEPRHIGPYFRVPGTDQAERCLTCGAVSGK